MVNRPENTNIGGCTALIQKINGVTAVTELTVEVIIVERII